MELAFLATLATASLIAAIRELSLEDKILLGYRWGLVPFTLRFTRHICVYGPTRSGKTSFVRGLIRELSRSYTVTVLDWHGEYSDLEDVPSVPYNKLRIDVSSIPLKLLVEVLGHGLNLSEPSLYMLYKILKTSNIESVEDIVKAVEEYFATTRTEAEMKAAILRRLEYVLMSLSQGLIDVELLSRYSCSVDLSSLTVIEEKKLATSLILAALYVQYMSSGLVTGSVRHVIVVEEAQNILARDPRSTTILDHIIMELGKYGVRVILVTNMLPPSYILKHCYLVMFKIRPEQIEREIVLSDELRRLLENMQDDEAIVITPSHIVKMRPLRYGVKKTHLRHIRHELSEHSKNTTRMLNRDVDTEDVPESLDRKTLHRTSRDEDSLFKPALSLLEEGSFPSNEYSRGAREMRVQDERASGSFSMDVQKYIDKLEEIEKKLVLIRERLDEIERSVAYEDEMLSKLLSLVERE